MIFLTDKSMQQNIKKFGYKSYDSSILSLVNQYLQNYTKNTISKALKKNKTATSLEASHVIQAGGRIVLPSEYFGVTSGSYFADLKNNGTDMAVTDSMIRPVVSTRDLSGAIKGGRIVLPSEYFDVPSGSYFGNLKNNGTDMAVTNTMIRPVVSTYDLSGAIKGGADKNFKLSKKAIQNAINEAKVSLHSDVKIRSDATLAMQYAFQKIMSEILSKSCGKCNKTQKEHLTLEGLKQISEQRKYKILS